MSYVYIKPAVKLAAVKQYWQTGNLKKIAEKLGVSRNAIYDWLRLAEETLERTFESATPGKRTVTVQEHNEKLQSQLESVLDIYHKISQKPEPMSDELARCPHCHTTALLRNGRVRTKRHGVRQRLWCRRCKASLYIDVKKTL